MVPCNIIYKYIQRNNLQTSFSVLSVQSIYGPSCKYKITHKWNWQNAVYEKTNPKILGHNLSTLMSSHMYRTVQFASIIDQSTVPNVVFYFAGSKSPKFLSTPELWSLASPFMTSSKQLLLLFCLINDISFRISFIWQMKCLSPATDCQVFSFFVWFNGRYLGM